jgi:hypothetical protein
MFTGGRRRPRKHAGPSPASKSLKLAFKHEVAPKEYLFRVWVTAVIAGGYFAYAAAARSGHFDLSFLLPMGGSWQAHDPGGVLYMETWSTILVDSLQTGFALWGGVLVFLGIFRIFTSHKYVFACFYLGIAFLGFMLVLPSWTQSLLNMLIEKCPVLAQ